MTAGDRIRAALRATPLAATPLVADEDEFDPLASHPSDPPPEDEGDDAMHAGEEEAR